MGDVRPFNGVTIPVTVVKAAKVTVTLSSWHWSGAFRESLGRAWLRSVLASTGMLVFFSFYHLGRVFTSTC